MERISEAQMVEEIMEVSDKICFAHEIDFMESCQSRVNSGVPLTEKQSRWLRDIYDRACKSPY